MAQVLPAKRPHGLSHRSQASVDSVAPRRKRTRLSRAPSVESSEDDVDSDVPEDEPSPVLEEANRQEDDEASFARASQIVRRSFKKQSDNTPADSGVIEEIGCTNFMCHEQLTVKLGPLINFIIGHNGSGKSAVLTALTLCLGGKATATNRGQNLKSFIKAGKDWSTLSVKIKNQGPGAYKADQYGDSIIVERHFTQNGTSGFKLKDRNGKIVSVKKFELEDIIDHFGLQIDNPLNVLTQDMARQFLNDSNAKDKYKFFLKGTQLEALDRDYSQIEQELEEQNAKHQTLDKDVKELEKIYSRLEKKSQLARGLIKLRAEETLLRHQATWAHVANAEIEAADCEKKISELSNTVQQRQEEVDTASENFARLDKAVDDATAAVEECHAELEPARNEEKEAIANFLEAKNKLLEFKTSERTVVGGMERTEKSMELTQSQIDEHKQRRELADGGLHAQKVRELEDAKAVYEERKSAWENHDVGLPALNKETQEAKEKLKQSTAHLEDKKRDESQSKTKIRTLERGQGNWTDAYPNGDNLAKLLNAIEADRRFREKPVGPIGRYVELKHPRWSSVLERTLGNVLNAFVVTNKADQGILSDMMQRFNYSATAYIISKTARLDTTGHTPDAGLLTMDGVLNISHDLVRNSLITNQAIEQVVLIQKRQEASELAHRSPADRPKVKAIYCWSDQSHRLGHQFSMNNQTGTTSMSAISEFKGTVRMQADKRHQIQEEKENLAKIQQEVRGLEAGVQAAQKQYTASQAKHRNYNTAKKTLEQQMQRAEEDVDRLDEEVAASVPDTAQLEQLEKELDDFKEQLKLDKDQYEDLLGEKDSASKSSKEHKRKADDATRAVKALEARLEQCRQEAHERTQNREQALRQKNRAIENVQEAEETRAHWQKSLDEVQVRLELHLEEAREVCERVDVPRGATTDSLLRKLEEAEKRRAGLEKELGGSQQVLQEQAIAAQKAWKEAEVFVKNGEKLRNSLTNALRERKARWCGFRSRISVRARATFAYLLSERSFSGLLLLDHNRKALDMTVQPSGDVNDNVGRQTKTLSGGEKSFSTICLLLALWDAMGSPLRCLDEFDVFMDSVNRDVSMKMIIQAARRSLGRQYILITPQAMNNKDVKSMQDVTVIKMTDPERGQTALNFSR
ncbi:dna repair protein-like protein rad18 [Karstenula rhodostoma CBS 690.94]|uniref:Dna repair protein-like protein rad18 n=1 Tax=Karstenula rhodostoma CBS 690.94 TaxID=1392251 RepID=A0A9P4UCJ8_9PLEO|nr:dna repair protein-like protein rad18 [Karstenula rhodostoma CBS 690.94]